MTKDNIVLIGMPGCGKSTLGPMLANRLGKNFLDTDELIKSRQKKEPREIVNEHGLEEFLKIQEKLVLELNVRNYVIATGGSIIYSNKAMEHLGKEGIVVYIEVPFKEIEGRLDKGRRLARNKNQNLCELYAERVPLYRKYADIIINCSNRNMDEIIHEIKDRLAVN